MISESTPKDIRPMVFRLFFFSAFGYLLYQFLKIISPFLQAMVVAVTLALVFYPLHLRIHRWVRGRNNLAAGTSVATLFFIVVVPVIFFSGLLVKQASFLYPWTQHQITKIRLNPTVTFEERLPQPILKTWKKVQPLFARAGVNPKEMLLSLVQKLGGGLSSLGTTLVKNLIILLMQTCFMIFTLFFLFRDGAKTAVQIVGLIPMESVHKDHVIKRLNETLTAVVRGMFVVATVQGLLAGLGFAVIGVRFSVVLGFATVLFAMVPMVGAAAIWVPVGLFLVFTGEAGRGIAVLLWGALVVSMVDNLLRPFIVGEKAKLPVVLLFFGTLGGLQVYGPIGLLLGPLVVASVLAFVKIYKEQMARTPMSAVK